MDAEVLRTGVLERRAHGVGHGADPDLEAIAVLDLRRHETGHRLVR
ncbi:MAG: hypothetical protein U0R78_15475 [Nocardioidaceae bacterium]